MDVLQVHADQEPSHRLIEYSLCRLPTKRREALVASVQAIEVLQAGNRGLDHPSGFAQVAAVGFAPGARFESGCRRRVVGAGTSLSVAAVGLNSPRFEQRPAAPAAIGEDGIDERQQFVTSCRLPPFGISARGMPCASKTKWRFEPGRARSVELGPAFAPIPQRE